MKTFGNISLAIIIGFMPLVAGCTTTSTDTKKSTVNIKRGNFESSGEAKIGNDIKDILAQGGLDTNNPAATQTAVVKADDTPKTLSTTATDLQTLVAQLSADSTAAAVQTPAPVTNTTPSTSKTSALALTEQPKLTRAQTQIVTTTETTTFAPIGTPGELVPIVPAPDIAAKTPEVKPKSSPRVANVSNKTRRVVEADSSYKSPTVKRF
jgi:hypothetical protein